MTDARGEQRAVAPTGPAAPQLLDARLARRGPLLRGRQPGEDRRHRRRGDFGAFVLTLDEVAPRPPRDPVVVLVKTGSETAAPGETSSYELTWHNAGPARAENAVVIDTLPAGVSFVSASAGGRYSASRGTVTWKLGTLAVNGSATLSLTVRLATSAAAGSVLVNRAELTADLTHLAAARNLADRRRPLTSLWSSPRGACCAAQRLRRRRARGRRARRPRSCRGARGARAPRPLRPAPCSASS